MCFVSLFIAKLIHIYLISSLYICDLLMRSACVFVCVRRKKEAKNKPTGRLGKNVHKISNTANVDACFVKTKDEEYE